MRDLPKWLFLAVVLWSTGDALPAADRDPLPDVVEFNRDIRPILSDNCYFCHGPDKNKRKADLRLDTAEGLNGKGDSKGTVVPGKLGDSELFRRITSSDPEQKMPPVESTKSLTPRDIAVIKKWIEQGAKYEGHWAFLPIKRPAVVDSKSQISNLKSESIIDGHIRESLTKQNLKPSLEADRVTLIRRLSFDLIGLPPTPEEVTAFVNDSSPDAYETLLWDVMNNDPTLFMRADQVEAAWRLLMPVLEVWANDPARDFPNYAAGSWGPKAAVKFSGREEWKGKSIK